MFKNLPPLEDFRSKQPPVSPIPKGGTAYSTLKAAVKLIMQQSVNSDFEIKA